MKIEELLKNTWLKSWEVNTFKEYMEQAQQEITQTKQQVIEDFIDWFNKQGFKSTDGIHVTAIDFHIAKSLSVDYLSSTNDNSEENPNQLKLF